MSDTRTGVPDPNEPGNRGGSGSASIKGHLDNDGRRSTAPRAPLGFDRARHTILVVDDSKATRYAIARGLRAAGYKTIEGCAGAEGIELAGMAAAVVLDVHLPDINGFEVCRLLRLVRDSDSLPIVHVSAVFGGEEDRAQSKAAGADVYLTAPVASHELACLLDRLLERSLPGSGAGGQDSAST